MEVKGTGSLAINELISQTQATRVNQQNTQGSVDTSSRQAEATSIEAKRTWNEDKLKDELNGLNQLLETQEKGLRFDKHEKLDRTMIRIVDKQTDEIIKEIPPEQFLDMISSMLEFAGLIIDEKI
ncbi:flagellar protein FlaG [Evansella sp. AB-rgal1]|uniref:flagellar protein FlaG n=1 Tax=Evansella sp. AB-rgal1 TaxID=3242696 RepID=UPI00359D359E